MRAAANKNFHLPLPPALYADLRAAAERAGTPATDVAREAIQAWLKQERRRKIQQELRAFTETYAGTEWDLDPRFEAAGIESIAKLPPWPNSPKLDSANGANGAIGAGGARPAALRKPAAQPPARVRNRKAAA